MTTWRCTSLVYHGFIGKWWQANLLLFFTQRMKLSKTNLPPPFPLSIRGWGTLRLATNTWIFIGDVTYFGWHIFRLHHKHNPVQTYSHYKYLSNKNIHRYTSSNFTNTVYYRCKTHNMHLRAQIRALLYTVHNYINTKLMFENHLKYYCH